MRGSYLCFVLGVLGIAIAPACSSSSTTETATPSDGGGGGESQMQLPQSDGGLAANVGIEAGTSVTTLEDACREAVAAQIERRVECGQPIASLLSRFALVELCPEYYSSPGSTRTLENVRSCVASIRDWPCADVEVQALPACLTPGTRAGGMPCAYGSQCQSRICVTPSNGCGTCADPAPVHSQCDSNGCAPGAFCHDPMNVCEAIDSIVHSADGAPCNTTTIPVQGCAGDLRCTRALDAGGALVCTRPPAEGEACSTDVGCAKGLVCVAIGTDTGTCHALRSCGAVTCDADSYCNRNTGAPTCALLAKRGDKCNLSGMGAPPCSPGLLCVPPTSSSSTTGVCMAKGDARKVSCSDSTTCPYGFNCKSGTCAPPDVASCGG